ncbi:hypothetical protein [Cryobacterium sp.]|uniref:hypothetical protein n=1 Tax=Cryobacterium sp. TaxID=1926290 RepID=UPI00261C582D|nr:hypothetical protein [Cryobacterium sp.]MCU1447667.1 hypothetical protein [Cryobacterium sp.]
MAVTLNKKAFAHARELVRKDKVVRDERDDWSEHAPSAAAENAFLDKHDFDAFGLWHLGVDADASEDTKGRYSFPIGDFTKVHRCAVISAESRVGQHDHDDIEDALKKLLEQIDA